MRGLAVFGLVVLVGYALWKGDTHIRRLPEQRIVFGSDVGCDHWALEQMRGSDKSFIVVLATNAYPKWQKIAAEFAGKAKLIYAKDLRLSSEESKELLLAMYDRRCFRPHKWVNDPKAIKKHLKSRFSKPFPTRVLVIECDDASAVKRFVRHKLRLRTVDIHIPDTHEESVMLGEYVFA